METVIGYGTSLEHVLAELARIEVMLRAQVMRMRQRPRGTEPGLSGLYIPDSEIDSLLREPLGTPLWSVGKDPLDESAIRTRLEELDTEIAVRSVAALEQDVLLRLAVLVGAFELAPIDVDIVVICLAPEVDRRYERLYAYLHDDVTRRRPTVDLITTLVCPDLETKLGAGRQRFGLTAPLRRHRLIVLDDDPGQPAASLLTQNVRLDPRVAGFLLGDDRLDERLLPAASLVEPERDIVDLVLSEAFRVTIENLVSRPGRDLALYLQGPYGVGKQSVAEACCKSWGAALLVVRGEEVAARPVSEFEELLTLALREARLQGAALYWDRFDALLTEAHRSQLCRLLQAVDASKTPVFLAGDTSWEPSDRPGNTDVIRLELPMPGFTERVDLWRSTLGQVTADAVGIDELARMFRLTGGQIMDAARSAASGARRRGAAELTQADVAAACRLQSSGRLEALADRIVPRYGWNDIVLPDDQLAQLREIDEQVRYRTTIFEQWGFGRLAASNLGINVLFAGPSGTGKTMAADVLAGSLGLELYRIDLSTVVSKYIGETEKNLRRIFVEARAGNAILFFDEADALFGKRTAVGDAHDRYANLETSYLLQQLEDHDSLVVLATNLRANLDDAFVRRLSFVIDFPLPDVAERSRIWTGIWPAGARRDPDLDLDLVADSIDLPGGNIRNIALAASFRAAADDTEVTLPHLWHAARREYQKVGKIPPAGPLGTDHAGG